MTSIGESAFQQCSSLFSITIPNSVTNIGMWAFLYCSGLTSITIPNSVTTIGADAFYGTAWFDNLPDGLIYAGKVAYRYKGAMPIGTIIFLEEGTTCIAGNAFHSCSCLTSITIPNSVISIGSYAFYSCRDLTTINIPNSVTSIGENAFKDCESLTSVTIGNSVKSIGDNAFSYCKNLTTMTIGNSVSYIGDRAFEGSENLSAVHISDLEAWCNIDFGGINSNHHLYLNGVELQDLVIPKSVTNIGNYAFSHCTELTSITIPNNVTKIGYAAFANCTRLTSVVIGNGIKTIGSWAFANCPELKDVYCYSEKVPSTPYGDQFQDSNIEYASLHVPGASINLYKKYEPWAYFKEILSLGGTPPDQQKCAFPTVSFKNGKLSFACDTEDAICVTTISDTDITTHYGNEINLTATYTISVYATKPGFEDSDVARATLCWISQEPQTEGIIDGLTSVPANAVLIQSDGGIVKVEGIDDGTYVTIYTPDGKQVGSAVCRNGAALVGTNMQPGRVAIIKIGEKAVKFAIK